MAEEDNVHWHCEGEMTSLGQQGLTLKLCALAKLASLGQKLRMQGIRLVWTNGCFDLLHLGHVRSLGAARRLGDCLIVGINSDASVRQLKGPGRPLFSAQQRAEMVAALACVDYVTIFDDLTPEQVLGQLRPDVHCKGQDYGPPHGKPIPEAAVVASYGGRIEFLPLVPGLSTSEIVARIRGQR
jgi:rfaE bifunctional protein nucleotidyltransferase chain/domain